MRQQEPRICDHCNQIFRSGAGLALHMRHVQGSFKRSPMSPEGDARRIAGIKARSIQQGVSKPCHRIGCNNLIEGPPAATARRKYCSKSCLGMDRTNSPMTDKQRQQISLAQKRRYELNPTANPFYGRTPTNYRGWGHGQFVAKLGYWVRSTWERDYLIALQQARVSFTYEPERFDLLDGRGTYMPDVQLGDSRVYIEITGWDKPGKAIKRDLFREVYGYTLYVIDQKPTPGHVAQFVAMCQEVMQANAYSAPQS